MCIYWSHNGKFSNCVQLDNLNFPAGMNNVSLPIHLSDVKGVSFSELFLKCKEDTAEMKWTLTLSTTNQYKEEALKTILFYNFPQ